MAMYKRPAKDARLATLSAQAERLTRGGSAAEVAVLRDLVETELAATAKVDQLVAAAAAAAGAPAFQQALAWVWPVKGVVSQGFGPTPQNCETSDRSGASSEAGAGAGRDTSNKLKRAEELNAARADHVKIVTEDEFCRMAGVPTADALKRQYHAMRDLLGRYRWLREDQLRYFVKCGVIRPVLRTNADMFFAFPDLAAIRQANEDLAEGLSFRRIVRTLLAARQGQLAFDFRLDAAPAKILTLRRRHERQQLDDRPIGQPDQRPAGHLLVATSDAYGRGRAAL